jgi:hypothetical protein
MWNGCSEIRETERKERGELLNEDGREMMKEILRRRESIEKERGWNCIFMFVIRNGGQVKLIELAFWYFLLHLAALM